MGITEISTPAGNEIKVYDEERLLCEILRGKGMSPFIVRTAMKRYFGRPERDVDLLREYAEILHVSDRIERFLDIYQ